MKYVNKWNLPLLTLMATMVITMVAVLFLFVLRLTGVSNLDIIVATLPLGIIFPVVVVWYIGLFIYSKISHKSFRDGAEVDYESAASSDDGWE